MTIVSRFDAPRTGGGSVRFAVPLQQAHLSVPWHTQQFDIDVSLRLDVLDGCAG
jgi:hypothetical protein